MTEHRLRTPFSEEDVMKLKIGDIVYLSGNAFTCRSRLHRAVFDEGEQLPFLLEDRNLLIHSGPVIKEEQGKFVAKSFGPTSSVRFEKWAEKSIAGWKLRAILGKGTMGRQAALAMARHRCVHICTMGIKSHETLRLKQVVVQGVHWKEKLGSIEAPWLVELNEYGPFLVDIDTQGNNYFDYLDTKIAEKKARVMRELGISEDFSYTELY